MMSNLIYMHKLDPIKVAVIFLYLGLLPFVSFFIIQCNTYTSDVCLLSVCEDISHHCFPGTFVCYDLHFILH